MIWDEFLRHFRFCDEEDSGLSDEEQERKGPKNRKRIHQAKKNFLEKFKTASYILCDSVALCLLFSIMERYNRQLLLPEIGEEGQARLKAARVLIVGVGGLGSPIALYLAGAGIGTIGLIDNDTVSENNLQRQVLYTEAEIGLPKAIQAQKRLEALNSNIRINAYPTRLTPDNAKEIIADYDIIVDGCDNFATRYLIDDTCAILNKVYVYGAIRAFEGQVSVFLYDKSGKRYRDLYPDEKEMLSMPHPPKGVMGVTPGLVGCAEANEVIKIICGYGDILAGKLWQINLKTMETYTILL